MATQLLIVFTFVLLVEPTVSKGWTDLKKEVEDCYPIENMGYFCTDDKTGYKKCDYVFVPAVGLYNGVLETKECPKGTRCACGDGVECNKSKRFTMNDICVPDVEPKHYEETFSLSFKQNGPGGTIKGDVVRDERNKRFFKRAGHDNYLVVPDEDGSLTKYHWTTKDGQTCLLGQTTIHKLPYFLDYRLDNLHPYFLQSSSKVGNKKVETFHYAYDGGLATFDSNQRWLTVALDPITENIIPMRMVEVIYASGTPEFYPADDDDESTKITYSPSNLIDSKTWAEVPDFTGCKEDTDIVLDEGVDDWDEEDWEDWDDESGDYKR